ncbi:hypothetical protein GJAV_G00259090 [Gymnothorax javanicus]|nr:hypothetical protein GJAV_G00259090 [Gymnothorax javanicus]
MAMSQGTYTFLTCFAGFWLVWAVVVLLCCLCNSLQRRLKRRRERRLRLQILDTPPPGEPPQGSAPPTAPQGSWSAPSDLSGKPPSYEDAVLMEDPPPPYSAILADAQRRAYHDPDSRTSREQISESSKIAPDCLPSKRSGRSCSAVIPLLRAEHCDSRGSLLSTLELNCQNLPDHSLSLGPSPNPTLMPNTTPSDLRLSSPHLDRTYTHPTALPVFGRSTAV